MAVLLPWRFAYASTQGISHILSGLPCQDSSICNLLEDEGGPVVVAVVSDGAGSASHSEIGSHLACASFTREISSLVGARGAVEPPERAHVEAWLRDFAQEVRDKAQSLGLTPRDLACTFVGAVIAPTWAAYSQVGDGAIVVCLPSPVIDDPAKFAIVFWPEQGEYANETYFATMDGAPEHMQFRIDDHAPREVALFSDGLQRMVLRYDTRSPFDPFFNRMFQTVRAGATSGELPELSRALGAYLGSPVVTEHSDDDVSLILLTQCPPLAEPPAVMTSTEPTTDEAVEVVVPADEPGSEQRTKEAEAEPA